MNFTFEELTQENAVEIANNWKYSGEYAFYDMTADPEDYAEFVDEEARKENGYFQAVSAGKLAGYFCVFQQGTEIEIGLGLRPDLCGRGMGSEFTTAILEYMDSHYHCEKYVLHVALFNQRAIKTYRRCGFQDAKVFMQETNGGVYDFLRMEKQGNGSAVKQ